MERCVMRVLTTSVMCLLSSLVFAEEAAIAKTVQPAKTVKDQPPSSNLKRPVRLYETFDNDGVDFGVRGDLLYMVYQAPVLVYASEQEVVDQILHSHILNVPGKPGLGCDVALMYTMPNQPGYSFELGWYHIVTKFSRNVNSDHLVVAHNSVLNTAAVGNATIHAKLAINFIDLVVKKDFAFGDWVSLTPIAGLVGGYMHGKSTSHFLATSGSFNAANVTSSTLAYTTKFEGIGMKLGGCSSFRIFEGFKLKAEFFYNVLYGFSKAHLDALDNAATPLGGVNLLGTDVHYSQHHGRAFFDSLLGLAWENRFRNDSLFLDLHIGWRFQTFSDGWQEFEAILNDSLHELSLQGQGLQAGATFKF